MLAVCLAWGFLSYAGTGPPRDTGRFEEAVRLIKRYEGWHGNHLPYIGYGHRLLPGERLSSDITEEQADSLLREDLRKLCVLFRDFGKDTCLQCGTVPVARIWGITQKPSDKETGIRRPGHL